MSTEGRTCAVVMAGGIGERFWPISRPDLPKQLLPLADGRKTLLQATVDRLEGLIGPEDRYIITSESLQPLIVERTRGVYATNVLAEPAKRNTLGAIIYATASILAASDADSDGTVLAILPADHHIGDPAGFRRTARQAIEAVRSTDALVTIGIRPHRPDTGYGYIQIGNDEDRRQYGAAADVLSFREKPDLETAESFLASGNFLWNAGMFFWSVGAFREQLAEAAPDAAEVMDEMLAAMRMRDDEAVRAQFEELPNLSVDYALMERAERVLMVEAQFPWDELGSWDAYARITEVDDDGNITNGVTRIRDSHRCVVYNDLEQHGIAIALLGVEGMVVAAGPGGILVMPVERAQEVREIAQAGAVVQHSPEVAS
ncbi:MAG: mannose-1-phosphate guanylyltransferase [candidate division WS1 bacterium]|nr:mannose-1-phosphate guanylyltransferase [candidate division WS1 bacterium]